MMTFGSHATALYNAESAKTKLWKSASVVVEAALLGAFFSVPQQAYADIASRVFAPAVAGKTARKFTQVQAAPQLADLSQQPFFDAPQIVGARPRSFSLVSAAPQSVDLTQQPFFDVPQVAGPGKLGRYAIAGPQSVDLTLPAVFDAPQLNPSGWLFAVVCAGPDPTEYPTIQATFIRPSLQGLVSGILGSYVKVPPQPYLTLQPFFDAPQVAGSTPRIIPITWTPEQAYANPAPLVLAPSTPPVGSKLGSIALAPQQAYSDIQPRITAAVIPGRPTLGAYIQASGQLDERLSTAVWRARFALQGPIPPLVSVQPQSFDYTRQGSFSSAVFSVLGPTVQKGELIPLLPDDRRIVITLDDRRIYPVPLR